MAGYIFTPREMDHPTEKELKLLLRHIGHDYLNDLLLAGIVLADIIEGSEAYGPESARKLNEAHTRLRHVHSISTALSSLGEGSVMPTDWNLHNVMSTLADYARQEWETTYISLSGNLQQSCYNSRKAIYLQLFHFVQNAAVQATTTQVAIRAEASPLTEEEQHYLGGNGSNYQPGDQFIRIMVQDDGPGIPESRFPDLFAPRDSSSTRGIGLSLADYVCDIVHGYIKVDSTVGEGSTFTLNFAQRKTEP